MLVGIDMKIEWSQVLSRWIAHIYDFYEANTLRIYPQMEIPDLAYSEISTKVMPNLVISDLLFWDVWATFPILGYF